MNALSLEVGSTNIVNKGVKEGYALLCLYSPSPEGKGIQGTGPPQPHRSQAPYELA